MNILDDIYFLIPKINTNSEIKLDRVFFHCFLKQNEPSLGAKYKNPIKMNILDDIYFLIPKITQILK